MIRILREGSRQPDDGPTVAGLFSTASNGGTSGAGGSGVRRLGRSGELTSITEAASSLPVLGEVDVLVCGGGPAGTAAAIAAARDGARTVLLERYGFVGGMASAGLVVPHFNPFHNKGLNTETIARLSALGGWGAEYWKISFDPELWKHVSEDMVLDSGADLLYHSFVVAALADDDGVRGAVVETKSGRFGLLAKVTIDCTGDADLAARAGAAYVVGRPGDGRMQPMTSMFRLGGVDWVQTGPRQLYELVEMAARVTGSSFRLAFEYPWAIHLPNPGEVAVQLVHVRDVDGTDVRDLTRAEIEGRRQALAVSHFLRDNVAEFANSYLIDTAPQIGVRETRRIVGDYELTAHDVLNGTAFDDGIATVSFPIDIHEPDDPGQTGISTDTSRRGAYDIPYRSLLPRELEHLLVAGRCISGTYEAHASYRVKGPCLAMGQAAGVAAALAARSGTTPRALDPADVRAALERQGVRIWHRTTTNPRTADAEIDTATHRRRGPAYHGPG